MGSSSTGGYSARDAAEILGVSVRRVREYARAAALAPDELSFQDVAFLKRLVALASDPRVARRVKRALRVLRGELGDRSIAQVGLVPIGATVAVREADGLRSPGSRQLLIDFSPPREPAVTPLPKPTAPASHADSPSARRESSSSRAPSIEEIFAHACELEGTSPARAAELYRHVIASAPGHFEARVNLGRVLHEAGELDEAEAHYRAALALRPDDATALFNLGVVLEDQDRFVDAIAIYDRTLAANPSCADAHFNLARLHELTGDRAAALRHLRSYRKLTRGR